MSKAVLPQCPDWPGFKQFQYISVYRDSILLQRNQVASYQRFVI